MIYLFYTAIEDRLRTDTFNFYLQQLPASIQSNILRYRKWQDAQRSLLGKVLLLKGIDYLGLTKYALSNLKYTELDKPYFDNTIDFNISHAGIYVICAFNLTGQIGVDVEEIKDVTLDDFESNFSENEWNKIVTDRKTLYTFYNYWTKKEAFLKAIGIGLNAPLNKIEVIGDKIIWEKKNWFFTEVKIHDNYILHFTSEIEIPKVIIQKIEVN